MGHHTTRNEKPIDRLRAPVERIIHLENISGLALIAGAVIALTLANSPLAETMDHFWHTHLQIRVGPIELDESLTHWINDGLMTIFFFVAGLEIKRELVVGDLRDPRTAALPGIAALGGMVVPAALYVAIAGPDFRAGWGVPMATDIAFAIGVLTLLGNRVPGRLKMLLLTLAIVDDLGAIIVIAVFYTASLNMTALAVAGGIVALMIGFRSLGVWWMPAYVIAGGALWLATFESGVHATLAGVVCGLLAPAVPRRPSETRVVAPPELTIDELKEIVFDTRETRSVVDRLIHNLHPFTALLIVPVFALANTNVPVSADQLTEAATGSLGQAIFVGLVIGKPLGIVVSSWAAVRVGVAVLPRGVTWLHMIGIGLLGGIGFTVSLFITDLAFDGEDTVALAKIAILGASIAAAAGGALALVVAGRPAVEDEGIPESADFAEELGAITFQELEATSAGESEWTPVPTKSSSLSKQ